MTDQSKLPQMNGRNMTCGGGFETWLQYVDGFELRHFCAFELLDGRNRPFLEAQLAILVEVEIGKAPAARMDQFGQGDDLVAILVDAVEALFLLAERIGSRRMAASRFRAWLR